MNTATEKIEKYKPYPEYKDSGVEWLGNVPEHWTLKRLKYVDGVIMGQSPSSDDYNISEIGLPFLQGNADFTELHPKPRIWCDVSNKISQKDDVLLSVRAPVGAVNISDRQYGIGRGLCAIRAKSSLPKLLYYFAISLKEELNSIATGSTYTAVSIDEVKNIIVPSIPTEEQQAIADFLDRRTGEIDELIAKKEQLIVLLREQRTAIISHAVTKGLNPDVKMKDSGIDWLGEIPEHWEVKKGKYLFTIISGFAPEQIEFSDDASNRYFRVDDLNSDADSLFLRDSEATFTIGDISLYPSETILFPKRGAAIFTNKVKITQHECIFDTNLMGLNVSRDVANIEYISLCLLSRRLDDIADTSTIPQINNKHIYPLCFPYPSLEEQSEIVAFLDRETSKIDVLIAKVTEAIEKLKEYRTALISAAVTGKIKVF